MMDHLKDVVSNCRRSHAAVKMPFPECQYNGDAVALF
jgi:hypothetical protein